MHKFTCVRPASATAKVGRPMFSAASLILFLMRSEMVLHELDNEELFSIINERLATLKQLHYSNKFAYLHF